MSKSAAACLLLALILDFALLGDRSLTGMETREIPSLQVELSDGQLFIPEILDTRNATELCPAIPLKNTGRILAALAPHHLPFAHPLLHTIYRQMAETTPATVTRLIVLGPDHTGAAQDGMVTAALDYHSSLGLIRTDEEFVQQLFLSSLVSSDAEPFEGEHAVYTQVPFILTYFPEARIVPILFRADVVTDRARALGSYLAKNTGPETLVILSSDLSHYQSRSRADLEDNATVEILQHLDIENLEAAGFDARPAFVALQAFLQEKGSIQGRVFCRSNSADLGGDGGNTTGYAAIGYGFQPHSAN